MSHLGLLRVTHYHIVLFWSILEGLVIWDLWLYLTFLWCFGCSYQSIVLYGLLDVILATTANASMLGASCEWLHLTMWALPLQIYVFIITDDIHMHQIVRQASMHPLIWVLGVNWGTSFLQHQLPVPFHVLATLVLLDISWIYPIHIDCLLDLLVQNYHLATLTAIERLRALTMLALLEILNRRPNIDMVLVVHLILILRGLHMVKLIHLPNHWAL